MLKIVFAFVSTSEQIQTWCWIADQVKLCWKGSVDLEVVFVT